MIGDRQSVGGSAPNAPGPPGKDLKVDSQFSRNHKIFLTIFLTFQISISSSHNSSSNSSSESSLKAQLTGNISLPMSNSTLSSAGGTSDDSKGSSPPLKRMKCDPKDMVDVCVGTSVGTITEPDCLGPCEPGTSVTLEGIVWHETEGGVLVVNVTWRGKTYVGTLIDCTKHDWAPPR